MRMMGQENSRLMSEVARLKAEVALTNSDCDKKIKSISHQLQKEKAKNKLLLSKTPNNTGPSANDDIILVAKPRTGSRVRSSSLGAGDSDRRGSVASVASASGDNRSVTPGADEDRNNMLAKKNKLYRL